MDSKLKTHVLSKTASETHLTKESDNSRVATGDATGAGAAVSRARNSDIRSKSGGLQKNNEDSDSILILNVLHIYCVDSS